MVEQQILWQFIPLLTRPRKTILPNGTQFWHYSKIASPHSVRPYYCIAEQLLSGVSFRFWTKNPPIFGPNPNKTHKPYPPTSAIKWVRKTPKKAIHPLVGAHSHLPTSPHTIPSCKLQPQFFFAVVALFSLHAQKRAVISVLNERAVYLFKKNVVNLFDM